MIARELQSAMQFEVSFQNLNSDKRFELLGLLRVCIKFLGTEINVRSLDDEHLALPTVVSFFIDLNDQTGSGWNRSELHSPPPRSRSLWNGRAVTLTGPTALRRSEAAAPGSGGTFKEPPKSSGGRIQQRRNLSNRSGFVIQVPIPAQTKKQYV